MNVTQYIEAILQREGGFVDHPYDKGGPTNWGITEHVARSFGYFGDMRQLPRETAFNIYLERYWVQPKFDKVNDLSQSIAEEMLDTGVNMGTGTAAKFLQRALNVLNVQEQHYPDIEVD
ncbi:MAG: glycoside hydrolase family 108 protein, partial [Caldilinea sp.]